jgi:hypothetical protein
MIKNILYTIFIVLLVPIQGYCNGTFTSADLYANNYQGNNAGQQIQACLNALPAIGGTCDASGITGEQTATTVITVPENSTLILGNIALTSSASIIISQVTNSTLIGQGALGSPKERTLLKTTASGGVGVAAAGSGIRIQGIHVKGNWELLAAADGSIGFDLQGMVNGRVENNRAENFARGFRSGYPTDPWQCDCYNLYIHNQVIAALIGVDFQKSSYKVTWIGGNVQPFGSGGTGFKLDGGNVVIISPDVENFTAGIAFDFISAAHQVVSPYIEAGGTVFNFRATATNNQVIGGTAVLIGDPSIVYASGADKVTNKVENVNGVILWPFSDGTFNHYFGQGSEPNYYILTGHTGESNTGLTLKYNPGSQAETVYGLTGFAPFHAGVASFLGGASYRTVCWKENGLTLGYCSTAPDANGACTCN